MVHEYEGVWIENLLETLWAYRSSSKIATGLSPFSLVYGTKAISPIKLLVPTPRVVHGQETDVDAATCAEIRTTDLKTLEETRNVAYNRTHGISSRRPMLTTGPLNAGILSRDKWF